MIKAIVALTRTPQNNLRIFQVSLFQKLHIWLFIPFCLRQDGSLVFAEECQGDLHRVLEQWFHDDADEPVTDKRDVASTL